MKKLLLLIVPLLLCSILIGCNSRQISAFADYANTYNQNESKRINEFNSRQSRPGAQSCFFKSDVVSGFNRICIYNCLGSLNTKTLRSTDICPLNF